MRTWNIAFTVLSILPLLFCISLIALYFHAGHILGYPPRYDMPDPKELNIYNAYAPVIYFSFMIWLLTFPGWGVLTVIYFVVYRHDLNLKPIVFSSIIQLLALLLMFSGIMEWFCD